MLNGHERPAHYSSEQLDVGTSNLSLSYKRGSEWVSKRGKRMSAVERVGAVSSVERANEWAVQADVWMTKYSVCWFHTMKSIVILPHVRRWDGKLPYKTKERSRTVKERETKEIPWKNTWVTRLHVSSPLASSRLVSPRLASPRGLTESFSNPFPSWGLHDNDDDANVVFATPHIICPYPGNVRQ